MDNMEKKQERELRVRVTEDTYARLEDLARREGFTSVPDFVAHLLISITKEKTPVDEFERFKTRLERYIQDELNKRLASLEGLRKQVVELYEKIEELSQKVVNLEDSLKAKQEEKPKETITRRTGIERLREEKVVFESKLPARIQRDRLFAYFERMNAIVLKLSKERVAVDPDYWRDFKNKLSELSSSREEDISQVLGSTGYELWKALYRDSLIYYDPKTKKWRFVEGSVP